MGHGRDGDSGCVGTKINIASSEVYKSQIVEVLTKLKKKEEETKNKNAWIMLSQTFLL